MSDPRGRIVGMDLLSQPLAHLRAWVNELVAGCVAERALQRASEAELALQVGSIAEVQRLVEALLVDAVGEVMRRSEVAVRDERMTSQLGCRDVIELVQTLTRVSPQTASRLRRAAKAVRPGVEELSGGLLEAAFPSVREAMLDGVVGVTSPGVV